jgi:hypothetical protein
MKTDENVVKVRTLVGKDHHFCIIMRVEELNMDKETARQILTTNLNKKKVCARMVQYNPPVFSQKTNTNTQTCPDVIRSCPT